MQREPLGRRERAGSRRSGARGKLRLAPCDRFSSEFSSKFLIPSKCRETPEPAARPGGAGRSVSGAMQTLSPLGPSDGCNPGGTSLSPRPPVHPRARQLCLLGV